MRRKLHPSGVASSTGRPRGGALASAIVRATFPALLAAILMAILPAIAVVLLLVLLASASGCMSAPEGISTAPGTEQDDIPAPENFVFDVQRSYELLPPTQEPEGKFRSWRGVYRGEGQVGAVVAWYVQHMPEHGWRIRSIDASGKGASFEKNTESAEIQVTRELDGSLGRYITVVKAAVRPLGPEDREFEDTIFESRKVTAQPAEVSGRAGGASLRPGTARTSEVSTTASQPRSRGARDREKDLEAIDEAEQNYGRDSAGAGIRAK